MLKFKKVKNLDIWTAENVVGDSFEIIKDTCDGMYVVYFKGDKCAVAGTLVTANMAIQEEKILNKKLQLDIVNKWIEDSKILELYYDLYLAKK